jgi:hypothetical protein
VLEPTLSSDQLAGQRARSARLPPLLIVCAFDGQINIAAILDARPTSDRTATGAVSPSLLAP